MTMMKTILCVLFLSWPLLFSCVLGNTPDKVNSLILDLFSNYDKRTRPVKDQDSVLKIDVSLYLSIINSVDEVQEKLTTTGFLWITWVDENLTWDGMSKDVHGLYLRQASNMHCTCNNGPLSK